MTVNFTPAPTVTAGNDISICSDVDSVQLDGGYRIAGGAVWSSPSGRFTDVNDTATFFTPSPAQLTARRAVLTLTTNNEGQCKTYSDRMIITFTPIPTVEVDSLITTCQGATSVQLTGQTTVATGRAWRIIRGGGTLSDSAALTTTYNPVVGDYTDSVIIELVTKGNGTCQTYRDTVKIKFEDLPAISAGPDTTICRNELPIQLAGQGGATWREGLGTFSPNRTTANATYMPTAAELAGASITLYQETNTGGGCTPGRDTVVFTFRDGPTVDAGTSLTLCANNATATLNGNVSGSTDKGIWTSSGTGVFADDTVLNTTYTPSATDLSDGFVILTLTSREGDCADEQDTMRIDFTPAPVVSVGNDLTTCANVASIAVSSSFTVASGGVWRSTGDGTFGDSTASSTTYTLGTGDQTPGTIQLIFVANNGLGNCSEVSDTLNLRIDSIPEISGLADLTVCADTAFIQLNASVARASGGTWTTSGTGTFSPSATALNAQYTPSAADLTAGSVRLRLTTTGNGICNAVTDSMTVNFTPAPTVTAGDDLSICSDVDSVQLDGGYTIAGGAE
jgi:hypothetical protein